MKDSLYFILKIPNNLNCIETYHDNLHFSIRVLDNHIIKEYIKFSNVVAVKSTLTKFKAILEKWRNLLNPLFNNLRSIKEKIDYKTNCKF